MSLMEIAMRRAAGGGLAQAMAAVAATVTAVAVFLMPAGVLEQAVLASGMADVFAPLQPPLGTRARLGLSLTAAGSAFGMVLLLMRLTGAAGAPRPTKAADEALPAPRLRRRDRHPDAPARAPLSAHRDLGDPVFEEEQPETVTAPAVTSPVRVSAPGTRRRAPLIEILGAAEQEAQAAEPEPLHPTRRVRAGRDAEPVAEPQPPAVEPAVEAQAPPEPVAFVPTPEPEPMAEELSEQQAEPEPTPVVAEAPPIEADPLIAAAAEPVRLEPAPASSASAKEQDLSELMARLELAMERKTARRRAAPAPAQAAEAEDSTDSRLRSALENLKRFAPGRS